METLGYCLFFLVLGGIMALIVISTFESPVSFKDSVKRYANVLTGAAIAILCWNLLSHGTAVDRWENIDMIGGLALFFLAFLAVDWWLLRRRRMKGHI